MRAIDVVPLAALVWAAVSSSGCLEPPEDDVVPLEVVFGDPDIDPSSVTHVEDDPAYASHVEVFGASVAYLRGYADGEPLWYWNIDGPNATFIAPLYKIVGPDGEQIGRTIIDVIPGDAGYTPWWREVVVRTTPAYDGQRIWSREAIDAGVRAGILEVPEPTERVIDCPVVLRETIIPLSRDPEDVERPVWVWYKNRRVHWATFEPAIEVPTDVREMPVFPVYVLQRIDEGAPLYEFLTGVDVDGDERLDNSNNIFASGIDAEGRAGPRYSPLWYVAIVRVEADYLSIDTSSTGVGLSAEDHFYDPAAGQIVSSLVVPPVLEMKNALVNCPIQPPEDRR